MKNTILVLSSFLFLFVSTCFAQEAKHWQLNTLSDPFWEVNMPNMDGYTLWLLRQNMTLAASQSILTSEAGLDNGQLNKIQFINYSPLFLTDNFNAMIGTKYGKNSFISDNNIINKQLQFLWLWTAWQYKTGRWNFDFTTENYYKGDAESLFDKTGNNFFTLVYAGYEINPEWSIILLGGYSRQQMENKLITKGIGGGQARFQPSNNFKMLFGAPTLIAVEWSLAENTDAAAKYSIQKDAIFFVRQRLTNVFSISMQFKNDYYKSNDTYFKTVVLSTGENYNNITSAKKQLSGEVGIKLFNDTSLNVAVGYSFKGKIKLYRNKDFVSDSYNSKDGMFASITLQVLQIK